MNETVAVQVHERTQHFAEDGGHQHLLQPVGKEVGEEAEQRACGQRG